MTDLSFPVAVSFYDESNTTLSFANPAKQTSLPSWGNECWWTDPPPPHCAPNLCQIAPHLCGQLPGGLDLMSDALNFRTSKEVGKVASPEDLDDIPPHLWPLIKTLHQLMEQNDVDLTKDDFSGVTITFHR
jgi:hypothetical protein